VVSEAIVAPMNTPCDQSRACETNGTVVGRRPPNMIASITTPSGVSQSEAMEGHWSAVTVKREFGCAAGVGASGVQSLPSQSIRCDGAFGVSPSHQMSPSSRRATLVKIVFPQTVSTAVGFVVIPVPGATPKKPRSGLMARSLPSAPGRIQAMSSPMVSTRQPGIDGFSIARLVLPQAEGNAAATW
jgi:hypothetical protein